MRTRFAIGGWVLTAGLLSCEPAGDLGPDPAGAPPIEARAQAHQTLEVQCFNGRGSNGQLIPLAQIIHELRATDLGDIVEVAIIFNREFVDNTYGANSIGWSAHRGHTFRDLYKSDHVELGLTNGDKEESFRAKIDYLSESASVPSGFTSLGVSGGDGRMISGSASDVVSFGTSMDDNFNRSGHVLKESSPSTDESYMANAEFPDWNFWVEYRLAIRSTAFGASGFGHARMEFVHASPSKLGTDTIVVEEGGCPDEGASDPFPDCVRTNPENDCYDPGAGGGTGDASGTSDPSGRSDPNGANDPNGTSDPNGTTCVSGSPCRSL